MGLVKKETPGRPGLLLSLVGAQPSWLCAGHTQGLWRSREGPEAHLDTTDCSQLSLPPRDITPSSHHTRSQSCRSHHLSSSLPSLPTPSFFLSIKELRDFLRPPTEQKKEFLWILEVCSIFKAPRWT